MYSLHMHVTIHCTQQYIQLKVINHGQLHLLGFQGFHVSACLEFIKTLSTCYWQLLVSKWNFPIGLFAFSCSFIWCYVQKNSNGYESDKHIFQDITTESTQQDIVAATVRNEVISKKPVSKSYLSAFMKLYMAKVFQLKLISVKFDFLSLIFDTR